MRDIKKDLRVKLSDTKLKIILYMLKQIKLLNKNSKKQL